MTSAPNTHKPYHFPSQIIAHVIWLFHRFKLRLHKQVILIPCSPHNLSGAVDQGLSVRDTLPQKRQHTTPNDLTCSQFQTALVVD